MQERQVMTVYIDGMKWFIVSEVGMAASPTKPHCEFLTPYFNTF